MAEDFNNNQTTDAGFIDPNRPRLKKVKRPVRKVVSGQPGVSVPPKTADNASATGNSQPSYNMGGDDFNLDALLDDDNLPALNNAQDVSNNFQPQFIDESDVTPEKVPLAEQFVLNNMFTKKAMAISALIMFVAGFFFAKIFFTEETVVRDGLQGVVINSEVPRGRARCGVAERTQGCVLYIMNPQRQEITARDFYDLASQLTGRQRFVIETGNMRYSNVKIRPGGIAQLNIPPLQ